MTKIVLWVRKPQTPKQANKIHNTFQTIFDHLIFAGATPTFPFELFQSKHETAGITIHSYSYQHPVAGFVRSFILSMEQNNPPFELFQYNLKCLRYLYSQWHPVVCQWIAMSIFSVYSLRTPTFHLDLESFQSDLKQLIQLQSAIANYTKGISIGQLVSLIW